MSVTVPVNHLFKRKRTENVPDDVDSRVASFPGNVRVPSDCDGQREGCAWNSPYHLMPGLACGQVCQSGDVVAGSPAWYRKLRQLVDDVETPIYLVGSTGGQRARLAFVDRGMVLQDDLVGSLFPIPAGASDVDSLLPKGARRDARIGIKGGLVARWDDSDAAVDAFYSIYLKTCHRLALRPLPLSFITHERERAPDVFRLVLAEHKGEVVAGKLLLEADGYMRILEGSALRDEGIDALMPDVFLTRAILERAVAQGISIVDFGITEGVNEGLRRFKRRMGFLEDPRVVSVERLAEMSTGRQDVALLEACNFGCGFCYREPWVPNLSTAQCQSEIDAVARLRHSGIALSGGEPTMREDLAELVAYARSRGIRDIQLHTNGWAMRNAGYSEELKAAGLTSAMISLHAHTADVFARVTSTTEAHFEPTLRAIENCMKAGVHTILSHVVNAYNYKGLSDWVRFIHQRFPGIEVFFFFVYPSVKGLKHPDMYPRLSDVAPYWYDALAAADELGLRITVDSLAGFPPCFLRGFEHHSKYAVARKAEEEIGAEADDHTLKQPEMRHAPGCAGCRWEDVCPGFWVDYMDRFGEDEFQAV